MADVFIGLAPAVLAALYFFGISALLLMLAATAGCVVAERAFGATPDTSATARRTIATGRPSARRFRSSSADTVRNRRRRTAPGG